jgi:hypothetical protein
MRDTELGVPLGTFEFSYSFRLPAPLSFFSFLTNSISLLGALPKNDLELAFR